MLPIALTEVLAEGFLLFRRALAAYDMYKTLKAGEVTISRILDRELRSHRVVVGENAYLYLVGYSSLKEIYESKGYSENELRLLVTTGLIEYLSRRAHFDPMTTVTEFGYTLGQICQKADSNFSKYVEQTVSSARGYTAVDPVLNYMRATGDAPVTTSERTLMQQLGIDPNAWVQMKKAVANDDLGVTWDTRTSSEIRQMSKPHRTQNFFGLLIRGAESIEDNGVVAHPVTGGPDALVLSMVTLLRQQPLIPGKPKLIDDRSITKQMVDAASLRIMKARGFVKLDDGSWAHVTQTILDEKDDERTGKRVEFRRLKDNVSFELDEVSADPVINDLRSLASSYARRTAEKTVRRAIEEVYRNVITRKFSKL